MYNQNIVYLQRFLSFVAIPTMKPLGEKPAAETAE